ncbi:MAG: hypothetical protein ACPGXL_06300, partial [Chitinophagales bacterium]
MEITITQFLQYLTFLAFISIFAVGINHLLLRFFKNLGVRRKDADATNVIRWAAQTKPAIGGFSFFLIFLLSIGFYLLSPFGSLENVDKAEFALLFSVSLGFFIGLVDDTYDLPPFFKFSGQLACAAIIIWSNLLIPLTGNFYMDAVATTFWVVMVMNAINLLDNMDGITASVSAFIVLAMFVVAVMLGNVSGFYAVVMLGTVGAMV